MAASPDAKAIPSAPPSSSATARSSATRVGLPVREYSQPRCSPNFR